MRIFILAASFLLASNAISDPVQYSSCKTIRESVVQPVLAHMGINSKVMEDLLVGTIATESASGRYTRQFGGGPALGIAQMEKRTYDDLEARGLIHPAVYEMGDSFEQMERDYFYSVGMSVSYYLWKAENYELPVAKYTNQKEYMEYLYQLAAYWKRTYNTHLGAGSKTGFVSSWFRDGCYLTKTSS